MDDTPVSLKYLVTGGAGFIGSHIVDALIESGNEVVVIDNLSSGSKKNLNPKAKFYPVNILSDELEAIFREEKPDIVNHHAAHTAVPKSVENPRFDAEQNIIGSINVIQKCIKFGVRKIVYASSGAHCMEKSRGRHQMKRLPLVQFLPMAYQN